MNSFSSESLTWHTVGAILGIGPPIFPEGGRVLFRVMLPADSFYGPSFTWVATNWGTPEQFLTAMEGDFQIQKVLRLAAEADPSDISPDPDLSPAAPVVPSAPREPAPLVIPEIVPPSGELDGPGVDLSGDPTAAPHVDNEPSPLGRPFVEVPDPQRREFPPGLDLPALVKQVPKEAWGIGAILLALVILK